MRALKGCLAPNCGNRTHYLSQRKMFIQIVPKPLALSLFQTFMWLLSASDIASSHSKIHFTPTSFHTRHFHREDFPPEPASGGHCQVCAGSTTSPEVLPLDFNSPSLCKGPVLARGQFFSPQPDACSCKCPHFGRVSVG